jgi:hypothetical protein
MSSEQTAQLSSLDAEYQFGHPKTYLAAHELARLTILRSKLGDTRAERAAEQLPRRSRRAARTAAENGSHRAAFELK